LIVLDPETGTPAATSTDGPDLTAALTHLKPEEQALIALRFGRELTVPEIAAQLEVPDGTVKSRLHAALRHLRAALDAERRFDEATR
jgi:RNA polymerase sigma-70 factor (ECF subfamily)